jgi:hypothetical protein
VRLVQALTAALALLAADRWQPAAQIAELENRAINESSGLAHSQRNPGRYWTHNDSGKPQLFLFGPDGRDAGVWTVTGARSVDWEDLAVGPGPGGRSYVYIGDIGNNNRGREEFVIYRVAEPAASAPRRTTERAAAIRFRYPDHPHDAEALLVHPATGDIYIVTKERTSDTLVFKVAAPHAVGKTFTLTALGPVRLPQGLDISFLVGRITGGAISPDGRRVVLTDYLRAYEAIAPSGSFDDIWKLEFDSIEVGPRRQGEAITYSADGLSLLLTSEGTPCPLFEARRAK